jgi:hypothetical protein
MTLRCSSILALMTLLPLASSARAQQSPPHVGYVYPAGVQQGTTIQVTIGGQYLDGAAKVYVSGKGVQSEVVEHTKPITQKQLRDFRERLRELRKKPGDADASKEIAEIQKKMASFVRRANPAIAENVVVRLTVAPDAEPGQRELRLSAASGLSNPLVFHVGSIPEFIENEVRPLRDPRSGKLISQEMLKREFGFEIDKDAPEPTVAEPTVINGQIMAGDVDRYRFEARKGQRLVVATQARQLIPYLADAVPGWFQATVAIYDAAGKELAYDDDYRHHPDPVLFCKIPADGQYVVEIKDAIYRGRDDFVYRITLSEQPFVTSIFPLGGPAGSQIAVGLNGGNLPVKTLTMDAKDKAPGVYPVAVSGEKLVSNTVTFAVDTLPESLEQEPNDQTANAQRVTLPRIVNGRIDRAEDQDVFCFDGRAGESVVAEVYARRLDSPLDSLLRLTDAAGKEIAFGDDHEDKGAGLSTHHADSLLTAKLPATGTYYLSLGDAQHQGGVAWGYRLRISPPQPDFQLRVVPSSISARAGMSVPITVHALRKDGFSGEIALAIDSPSKGCTLSGARVPAGQDEVRLTLNVPPSAAEEPLRLQIEGRAVIQGQETRRPAVAADDMMQAFYYHHLVPAQGLMVAVRGPKRAVPGALALEKGPVKLPVAGTATARFGLPRAPVFDQIQFALREPPEGIAIKNVSRSEKGVSLLLQADADKVKPGLVGNLIVDAFLEKSSENGKGKPRASRRVQVGTLPAIPFEVVDRSTPEKPSKKAASKAP